MPRTITRLEEPAVIYRPLETEDPITTPNVTFGWMQGLGSLGLTDWEIRNKLILDVGCGSNGSVLTEGPNVYGADPNLGRMPNGNGGYFDCHVAVPERAFRDRAEQLLFEDGVFDYVVSTKAVGWYPRQIDTEMATKEMLRVLRRDIGVAIFNVGQEMRPRMINPVLIALGEEGCQVAVSDDSIWVHLRHSEFDEQKWELSQSQEV